MVKAPRSSENILATFSRNSGVTMLSQSTLMAMSFTSTLPRLCTWTALATSCAVFLATDACQLVSCSFTPGGGGQALLGDCAVDAAARSAGASPRCGAAGVAFGKLAINVGARRSCIMGMVGICSMTQSAPKVVASVPPLASINSPLCTNGLQHRATDSRPSSSFPNVTSTRRTLGKKVAATKQFSSTATLAWENLFMHVLTIQMAPWPRNLSAANCPPRNLV